MAAGLRHRKAGDEQARAFEQALGHRLLQAEVGTGGVAHGGEAAHQHVAQDRGSTLRADQRRRLQRQAHQIVRRGDDVHVGIDQARQRDAPAAVDALGVGDLARLGA